MKNWLKLPVGYLELPQKTKIGNFQKFHTEGNLAISYLSYLKNILLIYL